MNSKVPQNEQQPVKRELVGILLLTALFIGINTLCLVKDLYFLSLILLIGLMVILLTVRFDYMLLCMALLTPFSVNLRLLPQMELSIPVEPLMILFCGIFFFRILLTRCYDSRILHHPISIALMASLGWMFVSACCSQIPFVSFKYFIARLWFVIPFFFASAQIFQSFQRILQFYGCYLLGLCIVIIITTINTMSDASDLTTLQTLHHVMQPFYNDHTAYGCIIALLLPIACHLYFNSPRHHPRRIVIFCALLLLIMGLYLSFCRAAWVSVAAALGMYILLRLGIKLKWMALMAALAIGLFFAYQGDIMYKLGKNHQDSSYDVGDQIKSITNIATDASNLERLNRWGAAFRLWEDHPIMGCGPGTYQFLYASYQRSYQMSVISTNAGDNGNAHSEYIGPLTEQGVIGLLLIVILFITTFVTGVRIYRTAENPNIANMALSLALGLLTYYVHGFFNNFLDTDKLSVPFWGFTAAIVALDLYGKQYSTPQEANKEASEPITATNTEEVL
ncbi:MAG: O-antigen ligase family protein [Bacteroidales bacterium]|nr:O-antigen ligase family protein [Bacteroidales bacterium]